MTECELFESSMRAAGFDAEHYFEPMPSEFGSDYYDDFTQCRWEGFKLARALPLSPEVVAAIEEAESLLIAEASMMERSAWEHPSDGTESLIERSNALHNYARLIRTLLPPAPGATQP